MYRLCSTTGAIRERVFILTWQKIIPIIKISVNVLREWYCACMAENSRDEVIMAIHFPVLPYHMPALSRKPLKIISSVIGAINIIERTKRKKANPVILLVNSIHSFSSVPKKPLIKIKAISANNGAINFRQWTLPSGINLIFFW